MPFLDTNSHLTTKPYNFAIKCQSNSESYDRYSFFGTKIGGGQNLLLMVEGFYNEREYSGADWLVPLIMNNIVIIKLIEKNKLGINMLKYCMDCLIRKGQC